MKTFFFTSYLLTTFYIIASYFLIDPSTDAEMFYIPLFAFGVAEVMMESGATYMICRNIPFQYAFMNIAIIGFARCGVGNSAGGAIVEKLMSWSLAKNMRLTSSGLESSGSGVASWFGEYFTSQNIMLAIKECLGYLALFGILMMLIILLARVSPSANRLLPGMNAAARWLRHPHSTPDPTAGVDTLKS